MLRPTLAIASAVLALAVAVAGSAFAQDAALPKVKGAVGPGFTITLKKNGLRVKTLTAGTYLFVIADKSAMHNFTLERRTGGEFEKHLTSTPFVGTKTVKVTVKSGRWKYYCSVHESTMHGFFTVK
jgi:plastocyanin